MAPRQQSQAPSYLDEHHQRISEFADEYFDDDDERSDFVSTLMTRRGYKPKPSWDLPDPAPAPGAVPPGAPPAEPTAPPKNAYFKR